VLHLNVHFLLLVIDFPPQIVMGTSRGVLRRGEAAMGPWSLMRPVAVGVSRRLSLLQPPLFQALFMPCPCNNTKTNTTQP
jgi:hypothetical protein